jgi:two-component system sensor histidine kinase/response regulator
MTSGDIMIVDDNPANLKLLENMLVGQNHEVRSFPLGRLALAAAGRNPPDLILLDINMPEMSGYQVCERLKSTPELAAIPVIFLSALNELPDKVKAFRCGAADYISKPFQFEEVNARVETHLRLYSLQRALKLQNETLEAAVRARTAELAAANQRLTILDRSKNEFLDVISHEFRTPLVGILGVGDLILDELPPSEENSELKAVFEHSRRRILSILDDALLLTRIDVNGSQFKLAPVALNEVLRRAIENAAAFADSRRVALGLPPKLEDLVVGDLDLLVRAVQALLETAVKFSTEGQTVQVTRECIADSPAIAIQSQGRTIPAPALPRFFDVLAIGEAITPGGDLGLAPALAYRILSLFGASVRVTNREKSGIRLELLLPPPCRDLNPHGVTR